jgi:hypothetical protein
MDNYAVMFSRAELVVEIAALRHSTNYKNNIFHLTQAPDRCSAKVLFNPKMALNAEKWGI